ncbi:GerAB/ArcD/ProY family transporter [Herbivorax sp. ANBcel31]|uniref:GerAB/ArcD/ProY family transporter n=1 Tax=Herbivorax sp. ANBcel31 TaxID=3069754 RepID=UPI0027B32DFE|nr:GerAB/ArcD/ProY family transporter [Herbivorax sp. ANBcel31]MDQ2085558.1 GerAB/ArcD/ProY family transporter [Herbivorax sp. ANBcel31]
MKHRFFYLLLINEIISNVTLYCPYILIGQLYDGTLIAIFAAFIISIVKIYFFLHVYNYFKSKTLTEINQILFRKFWGNFFSYTYVLICLAIGFFMYKGLVEIVKTFMLTTSSLWLISIILIIIPFVVFKNTSNTFLHTVSFTALIMVIGIISQVLLITGEIKQDFLIGSLVHSVRLPNYITIATAGFFFSGVYHLSLFNPEFKRISYKKTILLIGVVGLCTAFISVYIPVSIWGPEAAQKLTFPWVSTADTVSINLFVIERALYLMMPLFFLLSLSNTLIYSFVCYGLFTKLHPSPKLNKYIKLVICIVFVAGSIMIPNTKTVFQIAPIVMITWNMFHLLLSVLLYIRTKGKELYAK